LKDPQFQRLCFNAQSLNTNKAKALKAFAQDCSFDAVLITEARVHDGLDIFRNSRSVLRSIPHPNRAGTALILHSSIQIIYEEVGIEDAIVCTVEKFGSIFVIAVLYLTDRLTTREKRIRFRVILNEIHDQASNFQNPTIYLYGDFNEYEKTLESWVKKNEQLLSLNRLSIFDDYEHPFEYLKGLNHISPLVTRQDIHHLGASRIDYILSNSRLQAKTCNWMGYDHATFIIKMPILKTKHRKVTVSKRATILSDLSSIGKRSLQDYVNLIRDNLNEYHFKMNTVRGMTDSFGLDMKQDANTAVTSWIKKFSLFASMTSLMRFSIYQGEAFKILRKVTKYDQFLKRDGSIVSTIRSNSGPLITDQEVVEQTLITSLRERDDALVLNSCHPILRTASPLPPLSHSEIANLISRLSRH